MINKKKLLKNVREYSPGQIAEAVLSGEVSMYELGTKTEGAFTPLLKRQVKEILEREAQIEKKEASEPFSSNMDKNAKLAKEKSHSVIEEKTSFKMVISDEPSIETLSLDLEDTVLEVPNTTQSAETTTDIDNSQGMFSRPFSFKGRIRRTEYGITTIIGFIINMLMGVMINSIESSNYDISDGIIVLYLIILVPYVWFMWAQGAKRCHDRGNSGFYQLIPFYVFWMLFAEGDPQENEYGNSPK